MPAKKRASGTVAGGRYRRLVVGGGRAPDFPSLRPGDLSLNIDADAVPHVQGDINKPPFASGTFPEVYFEKVPYDAFTAANRGAIKEVARILDRGGRLVIETGSKAPLAELQAALRQASFKYVRVTQKGYLRITCRLGGT
jgi:hypothetical protein